VKTPPEGWNVVLSRALQQIFDLAPPETRDVSVRRSVAVPMDDGVILLADHYAPRPLRLGAAAPATVLVRSPYGRRGTFATLYGRVIAERGFQVFLQSCRGTAGSGGEFVPQVDEQRDGIATVRWLRSQPWCNGTIASAGMSYLGYTQYATATHPDAGIAALALQAAMADLGEPVFGSGGFSLANSLTWARLISLRETRRGTLRLLGRRRELAAAFDALPLGSTDQRAVGRRVGWYQDWLANPSPEHDYWRRHSHRDGVPAITAPTSMLTGWQDLFLPWMLRDYARLAAAGNPPELTIGPWCHATPGQRRAIPGTTIRFLREHLLGADPSRAQPVRIFVTGDGGGWWRDLPSWPPPAEARRWQLTAGGLVLGEHPSDQPVTGRSTFSYDPADPTPALGGPTLAGRTATVDNADHELRPDVITFTSPPLRRVLEVAGTPVVELRVQADSLNHDVFARLCEVDDRGRSWNVCDQLVRLGPNQRPERDGSRRVRLELWACAHRFARGHRVRLQVSGGAHPRYARNPGTGADLATAVTMKAVTITVHHAGSRLILPTITRDHASAPSQLAQDPGTPHPPD